MDKTAVKLLRLYEHLCRADAPLGVSALAAKLKLTKSNAHRILRTLTGLGYAQQGDDGRYAPTLKGVSAKHIYEAMQTGPQQMPVFSDDVITPEDKRNVIAYVKTIQNQPKYGGLAGGGVGPVAEGMFTFLVGIGVLTIFAVWIGAHGARVKKGRE